MKTANVLGTFFKGTTAIRAVTDSHQEARLESEFLSKIAQDAKKQNNILLLNGGDLFGGVYSRDLMRDIYITFKRKNPNVEVVFTIGNNDPISSKDKFLPINLSDNRSSIDFFFDTIKEFEANGIKVVCSNLRDRNTGENPCWIKPYTIVERDGDRISITGFCINRLPSDALDINVISHKKAFDDLVKDIDKEKPDSIVVLNHDYLDTAKSLIEYAKQKGVKIDLIIDGHDHNNLPSIPELNIYNPKTFSKSMLEMDLIIKDKVGKIMNVREVESKDLPILKEIDSLIEQYEKDSGILNKVAPYVLNLPKTYEEPGELGTFIADGIKKFSDADVAFFASNAVRVPLFYKEGKNILNYDIRKTITFDSTVQIAEFTPSELRDILMTAFENRLKLGEQNARFLQCSSNVKIVGEGRLSDKSYKIKQIYLNNSPLFDEEGIPINKDMKILCAFDSFIPTDGRSSILMSADKKDVIVDGRKLRLDEVLRRQLVSAVGKYKKGTTYPKYQLEEIIY